MMMTIMTMTMIYHASWIRRSLALHILGKWSRLSWCLHIYWILNF